jgi:hypothetical protein
MALRTPRFDLRAHIPAGAADVLAFGAAFVAVIAAAALTCLLVHWS